MALHSSRGNARTGLLHGTLDMLILRTLERGPLRGSAIGQVIRSLSFSVLRVETGSLYPALQRLGQAGWVVSGSRVTAAKQRVTHYRLTAEGKQQIRREQLRWRELVNAISGIMSPEAAQGEPTDGLSTGPVGVPDRRWSHCESGAPRPTKAKTDTTGIACRPSR